MTMRTATFLMFQGQARDALELYQDAFDELTIDTLELYAEDADAMFGQVKKAEVSLGGHALILHDTGMSHAFGFTPAISLFIDFGDESALERAFDALSEGGTALMPLDDYGFSARFAWVQDRYGVSWQLNLV